MSQEKALRIEEGAIVAFDTPTKAYNGKGAGYLLDHGLVALILETSEYDLTIYTCGEVLYCSPDSELFLPNC